MRKSKVAILMGSDSDFEVMKESVAVLKDFGIDYDVQVLSAHRSPDLVTQFVRSAEDHGFRVFIAGAGGAAHLAGVIAAQTKLPVIGVPIDATSLKGLDALLATVQMPAGIPVAAKTTAKQALSSHSKVLVCKLPFAISAMTDKRSDFKRGKTA